MESDADLGAWWRGKPEARDTEMERRVKLLEVELGKTREFGYSLSNRTSGMVTDVENLNRYTQNVTQRTHALEKRNLAIISAMQELEKKIEHANGLTSDISENIHDISSKMDTRLQSTEKKTNLVSGLAREMTSQHVQLERRVRELEMKVHV